MDTMEMITKALEAVVEQKVAEKATTVNLESIEKWVETASKEDMENLIQSLANNEYYKEIMDKQYQERLDDDNSIINKDDIDVDTVEDCGLLEDCYERYLDKSCDLREIAKDIIDRI